jgi:hypothetical protein
VCGGVCADVAFGHVLSLAFWRAWSPESTSVTSGWPLSWNSRSLQVLFITVLFITTNTFFVDDIWLHTIIEYHWYLDTSRSCCTRSTCSTYDFPGSFLCAFPGASDFATVAEHSFTSSPLCNSSCSHHALQDLARDSELFQMPGFSLAIYQLAFSFHCILEAFLSSLSEVNFTTCRLIWGLLSFQGICTRGHQRCHKERSLLVLTMWIYELSFSLLACQRLKILGGKWRNMLVFEETHSRWKHVKFKTM